MESNNSETSQPPAIAGALTYPSSSAGSREATRFSSATASNREVSRFPSSSTGSRETTNSSQSPPEQPKQPRNLQGLLRFAMDATKAEDAPGNADIAPMDDQRREFLQQALRGLTVNLSEVLDNALKVLTNTDKIQSIRTGEPLPDDVQNAFTILLDYVDDMDVANDFYKMGGFAMFPICYSSENAAVRSRASAVLGTLCQNNPFCQTRALDCGLLHLLLNLVQQEQGPALAKCLYALSCTTRGFVPACSELIKQGGCDILAQLLSATEPAARTKAAFLVRYYSQHFEEAKGQFIKLHIIKTIASEIQRGRDESTEHLLSILSVLMEGQDPKVVQQCRSPTINLKQILEDHLKRPELQDDRFREEKEYCNELLLKLFDSCPATYPDEEVADR